MDTFVSMCGVCVCVCVCVCGHFSMSMYPPLYGKGGRERDKGWSGRGGGERDRRQSGRGGGERDKRWGGRGGGVIPEVQLTPASLLW